MFLFHRRRSLTVLTATISSLIADTNVLCDTDSWNVIKGDWTFNATDCSLQNTDSGNGNIVWFGSEDGLIPLNLYSHDSFSFSVSMKVESGYDGGVLFRTGECSTTNDEGPSYFVGLRPSGDDVRLGILDDGWTLIAQWSVDSLEYDVPYTLSIYAVHNLYYFYLDDQVLANGIELTEFNNGSVGLRTYKAPSTYYSMTYSEDIVISLTPNTTIIESVNVSTSSSAVTSSESWSKNNGIDNKWYDL